MGWCSLTARARTVLTKYGNAELIKLLIWRQVHCYILHCIAQWLNNGGSEFQETKVRKIIIKKKSLELELAHNFLPSLLGRAGG